MFAHNVENITSGEKHREQIINAYSNTLKNSLNLIGIEPVERM